MPLEVKWEYLSIWADSHWFVMSKTTDACESLPEQIGLIEYMNQLGCEGWELVAMIPVEVGFRAFFKRPSQNDDALCQKENSSGPGEVGGAEPQG